MEAKCRAVMSGDIATGVLIKRSCGGVRRQSLFGDTDWFFKATWAYQEECGLSNPMKRNKVTMNKLLPLALKGNKDEV